MNNKAQRVVSGLSAPNPQLDWTKLFLADSLQFLKHIGSGSIFID